jgi:Holliday junction resolvase
MAMLINMAMIITMAMVTQMPRHYPNPLVDNEAHLQLLVAELFREQGWKVRDQTREENLAPDLIASRQGRKLIVEVKRASEGRRDRVIPLLSQAVLEAAYYSRSFPGHPMPVAIVGANHIPELLAEEAKQFVRERAPNVAVGLVDLEGFRSFAGHGLESLNSGRRPANIGSSKLRARAPQLFSDLNQWMLKVLLAPSIPESYLSAPRGHYQGASQLAAAAGVSIMSAFRFVEEFSKEGFLESTSGSLRVVRSKELLNRWKAASQRRVCEIPMQWVLHKGKGSLANAVRSYESFAGIQNPNGQYLLPHARLCLGLFEAAEALGIGFVHGVKPHLYVERMKEDVLKDLGLSGNSSEQQADIYIRVPGNRESIFRGAVQKDGVPVSDILQVWLDVGQHPSRGREQAELIWRRILSPVFEAND